MKTRTGTVTGNEAAEAGPAPVLLSLAGCQLGEPDPDEAPLTPAELRRAGTFAAPSMQRRFVASRQAARRFVAGLAGVEPAAVAADYQCPECGPDAVHSHGVPQYRSGGDRLQFQASFSRSGEWLLAGAAATAALGIDLADLAGFGDPGLDAVISTAAEQAQSDAAAPGSRALRQAQLWTRKEAVLKATGDGLRIAPHLVEGGTGSTATVVPTGQRIQVVEVDVEVLGLPAGLVAAAAVPLTGTVRVQRVSWR